MSSASKKPLEKEKRRSESSVTFAAKSYVSPRALEIKKTSMEIGGKFRTNKGSRIHFPECHICLLLLRYNFFLNLEFFRSELRRGHRSDGGREKVIFVSSHSSLKGLLEIWWKKWFVSLQSSCDKSHPDQTFRGEYHKSIEKRFINLQFPNQANKYENPSLLICDSGFHKPYNLQFCLCFGCNFVWSGTFSLPVWESLDPTRRSNFLWRPTFPFLHWVAQNNCTWYFL